MSDDQFPDRLLKKLPEGWADSMQSADLDALKKAIVECEGNLYVIQKEKEGDEKLNAAKALVKDYSSAYRDASAVQKAKIQYALWLMDSRGHNLDSTEA